MRNISIHLAKLVAALGVVGVHTNLSSAYDDAILATLLEFFIRISVPLFFVISGYFFYSNILTRGAKYGRTYFKRLVIITLVWGSLYFLRFCLVEELTKGKDAISILSTILHKFLAYGGFYHFWFLTALVGSCIVLWIIIKKDWLNKKCLFFCSLLYILGYYFDNTYRILPPTDEIAMVQTFLTTIFSSAGRNFLFFGTPLVVLGASIHKYQDLILQWSRNTKLWLLSGSIVALLCEIWCVYAISPLKSTDIYLLLPIASGMLLIILIDNPLKGHEKYIPDFLLTMDLSLGIYIIHPYIFHIYRLCRFPMHPAITTSVIFIASTLLIFSLKKLIRTKAITQYF